jgi:hypothetical protein
MLDQNIGVVARLAGEPIDHHDGPACIGPHRRAINTITLRLTPSANGLSPQKNLIGATVRQTTGVRGAECNCMRSPLDEGNSLRSACTRADAIFSTRLAPPFAELARPCHIGAKAITRAAANGGRQALSFLRVG